MISYKTFYADVNAESFSERSLHLMIIQEENSNLRPQCNLGYTFEKNYEEGFSCKLIYKKGHFV